ncbi:MAG: glycosyltransferase [Chitinophagales bacterium]|nr:glycosyltransferase [Chitinophagales bacterium]MDW8394104.1 glycosyltransferase [Chitinophagales bacterium]
MKHVVYVSYDGLTDPLGRSQILPYLIGLAGKGHRITLVSAEKPERYRQSGQRTRQQLQQSGVHWLPVRYQAAPKGLSTLLTLFRLYRQVASCCRNTATDLIHCRSYLPALIGSMLKKKHGIPFVFDMKGFWVDERVDGSIWPMQHWPYRLAFRYFKKKERSLLAEADYVVTVTHKAKEIILSWQIPRLSAERIGVIPSSADPDHFRPCLDAAERLRQRQDMGIGSEEKVLVYCGSLRTWYLPAEMLLFFRKLLQQQPFWKFLIITTESTSYIEELARKQQVPVERLMVVSADYDQVPHWLELADLSLFFIKPCYSKQASSPTKLSESMSMGLPVVCNDIGDVRRIVECCKAGLVVHQCNENEFEQVIPKLEALMHADKHSIRQCALNHLNTFTAIEQYHQIYQSIA